MPLTMRAALVCALLSSAAACTDDINTEISLDELYTREFVKQFGEFKAESWSQAVAGVVTVRTSKPTGVNVFAEIDGRRFIFASLSSVKGATPIVVNVPSTVKELIVVADGMEYRTALGEVLDLTADGSRYYVENSYVDHVASLGDFGIRLNPDVKPEIEMKGSFMKNDWLQAGTDSYKDFRLFDGEQNFTKGIDANIYGNSSFYCSPATPNFTIYPVYWRENIYGEKDYLLGVYYYNEKDRSVIKMIDLEDFDVTQAISFKATGATDFVVSQGKEAYNAKNLKKNDYVRMKGYHMTMLNFPADRHNQPYCVGFYIKSGLKDGYTPGKGRNYTHISFQSATHNAPEWGSDNYWNVKLKDVHMSYIGSAFSANFVKFAKDKPTHVDGYTAADLGTDDYLMKPLAFMSQPDGVSVSEPDMCDVVLALSASNATYINTIQQYGNLYGAYPWYLASEDLGSMDDWDFNDLVVNIYDVTTDFTRTYVAADSRWPTPAVQGRRITVVPRAAGGIYPIYLMYEGSISKAPTDETLLSAIRATEYETGTFVVGTEMHAWLGQPDHSVMLNTGLDDGHAGRAVSFCVPVLKDGEQGIDPADPPQDLGFKNQTMHGFWVLVDKNDEMRQRLFNYGLDVTPLEKGYIQTSDDMKMPRDLSEHVHACVPFEGSLGNGAYRIDVPGTKGGVAPQMLMCFHSWRWCRERANISKAFTSFSDWVAGRRKTWHGNYGSEGGSEGLDGFNADMLCDVSAPVWME